MVRKLMVVMLVVAIAALLFASACGPAGPAGSAGAVGSAGAPGAAGAPGEPASTAMITVTPASGPESTPTTILGAGFQPGEKIVVTIVSRGPGAEGVITVMGLREQVGDAWKTEHIANEQGCVRILSYIGRKNAFPPGTYQVTATGDKGSVAMAPLEITE